jgi:hypothetical protein
VSFAGGDALAGEGGFATFSHELFHGLGGINIQCRVGRLQFIPASAARWRTHGAILQSTGNASSKLRLSDLHCRTRRRSSSDIDSFERWSASYK